MILFIANARRKGGLSGSDNIYEHFKKYWACEIEIKDMQECDFWPFWACYVYRILRGCLWALKKRKEKTEFVYSCSDFLMDSIPAYLFKRAGHKWVAGFYLMAQKDNPVHFWTQKIVHKLIMRHADIVLITNNSYADKFPGKKIIAVHGGVDLHLCGKYRHEKKDKHKDKYKDNRDWKLDRIDGRLTQIWNACKIKKHNQEHEKERRLRQIEKGMLKKENGLKDGGVYWRDKAYDAVFCGRLHKTKGIDKLIEIWRNVNKRMPGARLAVIGDGDLGKEYLLKLIDKDLKIDVLGYMDNERFDIYRQSKLVLYPATADHFSMSPVEAMACGCPMVAYDLPVMKHINPKGAMFANDAEDFSYKICYLLGHPDVYRKLQAEALGWSQEWDWEKRADKIWKEINEP